MDMPYFWSLLSELDQLLYRPVQHQIDAIVECDLDGLLSHSPSGGLCDLDRVDENVGVISESLVLM